MLQNKAVLEWSRVAFLSSLICNTESVVYHIETLGNITERCAPTDWEIGFQIVLWMQWENQFAVFFATTMKFNGFSVSSSASMYAVWFVTWRAANFCTYWPQNRGTDVYEPLLLKENVRIWLTPWSWALHEKPPVVNLPKNFRTLAEPKDSVPCSQDPCTGSYPEANHYSYHPILAKMHFNPGDGGGGLYSVYATLVS
jgi:hypothetical protein